MAALDNKHMALAPWADEEDVEEDVKKRSVTPDAMGAKVWGVGFRVYKRPTPDVKMRDLMGLREGGLPLPRPLFLSRSFLPFSTLPAAIPPPTNSPYPCASISLFPPPLTHSVSPHTSPHLNRRCASPLISRICPRARCALQAASPPRTGRCGDVHTEDEK